ncbi:TetR/AcrR family transcriptional regulator [Culicoidibacter larvae]|nr:TetR/AcrR family transcriptional regulator [Culicoidibacter larvae]
MLISSNPTAIQSQTWIIDTLLALMSIKNYNEITVSEICRKAKLDRRTFYRNFNSKTDVLDHYITTLGKEYLNAHQQIDVTNALATAEVFFRFWQSHTSFITNIQKSGLSNFVFKQFTAFTKENIEIFTDDKLPQLVNKYVYSYRIGGFWNIMLTWITDGCKLSPNQMATIFQEYC